MGCETLGLTFIPRMGVSCKGEGSVIQSVVEKVPHPWDLYQWSHEITKPRKARVTRRNVCVDQPFEFQRTCKHYYRGTRYTIISSSLNAGFYGLPAFAASSTEVFKSFASSRMTPVRPSLRSRPPRFQYSFHLYSCVDCAVTLVRWQASSR